MSSLLTKSKVYVCASYIWKPPEKIAFLAVVLYVTKVSSRFNCVTLSHRHSNSRDREPLMIDDGKAIGSFRLLFRAPIERRWDDRIPIPLYPWRDTRKHRAKENRMGYWLVLSKVAEQAQVRVVDRSYSSRKQVFSMVAMRSVSVDWGRWSVFNARFLIG